MLFLDKAEQTMKALNQKYSLFNKKSNGGLVTLTLEELELLEWVAKDDFRPLPDQIGGVYKGGVTERKNFRPFALFHPIVTKGYLVKEKEEVAVKLFSVVIPTKIELAKGTKPPVVYLTGRTIEEENVAFVHEWVVRYFYNGEYHYKRLPFAWKNTAKQEITFSETLYSLPLITIPESVTHYTDKKEVQIV